MKRAISLLLILLLCLAFVPLRQADAEDRTPISTVVATSNISELLVDGGAIQNPTITTIQGSPAYINTGATYGYWWKKEGDTWKAHTSGKFSPGTWKFITQLRIDSSEYVLSKPSVTVDGSAWTVNQATFTLHPSSCYIRIESIEYSVVGSIASASVTIPPPTVGNRPSYSTWIDEDAPYYSDDYSSSIYLNDVSWVNVSTGEPLPVDAGVFEEGCTYKVIIYLTAKAGYVFTNDATSKINWCAANSCLIGKQLQLEYTFPTLPFKPVITAQPKSVSAAAGATAKFTVAATGATSYQWQWSPDNGTTWKNSTSATTGYNKATLQVSATTARNGYKYRCIVTNSIGSTTSAAVTLTVK